MSVLLPILLSGLNLALADNVLHALRERERKSADNCERDLIRVLLDEKVWIRYQVFFWRSYHTTVIYYGAVCRTYHHLVPVGELDAWKTWNTSVKCWATLEMWKWKKWFALVFSEFKTCKLKCKRYYYSGLFKAMLKEQDFWGWKSFRSIT